MTLRRTMPAAAAVLAAMAMVTAGCSSNGNSTPDAKAPAAHHDNDAVDSDHVADPDSDAPGVEIPGEDEDEDSEAATLNPAYAKGTPNRAFTVKGYSAVIDLRSLPSVGPAKNPWSETPRPHLIESEGDSTQGPVQTKPPTGTPPKVRVNVLGLDYAHFGAGHPPDTSGAVGPDNFIQTVNTSIGVYDKQGNQINAFRYNTFFSQFHTGTPCDNQNGGDPQVIFDRPSNRWIVADLSYPGPYYFCMAVSDGPKVTDNPSKWTMYPYKASDTELNDYPKIASGPDGLYVTSNMFTLPSTFNGAQIWAYKRSSLGTSKLKVQTVRTSNQYGGLLPANQYTDSESAGPEYLTSLETSTSIGFWVYKVNWKHPSRSKFTQTPKLLTVNSFVPAHGVPQQGGAGLDTLSDRPMYALQWANDGTLWMNHSVQVDAQAGVRWYQIGDITGSPKILQQSTFAPSDGLSRWMGSLAVDKDGNMAVGYSVSSSSSYPSIRFATRESGDKPNKLTAEGKIVKGTGAQTGISRWGDYAQMSLDPEDDCTMWFTEEYYVTTGGDWQTRIASFKFPGCK